MIPPLKSAIASYIFLARSRGYETGPTAGELQASLDDAIRLADGVEASEPAALFYSLARRPAELDLAWRTFPRVMARNHGTILGFELLASDDELEELGISICLDGLSFEAVRDFFAARLVRRGSR